MKPSSDELDKINLYEETIAPTTRLEREQFWKERSEFRPKNWEIIPINESRKTFAYEEFTFEKELHWKGDTDDILLGDTSKSTCLIAATATGKTSSIFRVLSKRYGLYFTCDKITWQDNLPYSKDYLMGEVVTQLNILDQEGVFAFGVNIAILAFMSRIMFLLDYIEIRRKKDDKFNISYSQFLQLQTNGRTQNSGKVFDTLIRARYHHFSRYFLVEKLTTLLHDLTKVLKVPEKEKLPIFIDEAQLFCPNIRTKILEGKHTVTRFSTSRSDDIIALFLDAFRYIRNRNLTLTGTAYSSELLQIVQSSAAKQDRSVVAIVGQSLIETKEDLREKLETIMNITDELRKFIDTSIQNYLPIRRRVFTRACANILNNNQNTTESFIKAFDDSMEKSVSDIKRAVGKLEPDFFTLQVLKFYSLYNLAVVDDKYLGILLPKNLENMIDFFITSGVAPYRTDPYYKTIDNTHQLAKSDVLFNFKEPLCQRIAKDLCKDIPLDDCFFGSVFESLTPKSTEKNDKFDVAFPVAILGRLAGKKQKIRELPFFKIVHESSMEQSDKGQTNFQKNYASFSESDCVFTIKAFICENTIKKYLASLDLADIFTDKSKSDEFNSEKLKSISGKVNNILVDTTDDKYDRIYWEMFSDNDLFELLVGVCYLPSKYAHPDCWILTQIKHGPLTRDNCGFISFAYKLHRDTMAIEQENVKNTYQSSMEYVYSKKKGTINSIKHLQCASLLDLCNKHGDKLLFFSSDTDRNS